MPTNPDAARVLSMCDYRDELSRRATPAPWSYDGGEIYCFVEGEHQAAPVCQIYHESDGDGDFVEAACNSFDAHTAYMRARCEDCMGRLLTDADYALAGGNAPIPRTPALTEHDAAARELSALAALCAPVEATEQYAAWKAEEGR